MCLQQLQALEDPKSHKKTLLVRLAQDRNTVRHADKKRLTHHINGRPKESDGYHRRDEIGIKLSMAARPCRIPAVAAVQPTTGRR